MASRLRAPIMSRKSVMRLLPLIGLLLSALLGEAARADTAQYYYDPDGRLVGVVDPVNGSAQYTYDATGNILSVTTNPITALVVMQFSPAAGPAGTLVTIAGTGFGTTSNTSVKFNGRAAQPTSVTTTSITVRVPAGATSGPVTVKAPSGTVTTAANYTVRSAPAGPTLTSFSPTSITAGSTITITGQNFDPVNSQILVNGRLVQVNSATSSSITATVPVLSSGHVTVITPNGQAASSSDLIVSPILFPGTSSSQRVVLPAVGAAGRAVSAPVANTSQASLVLFDATAGSRISTMQSGGTNYAVRLYAPDGSRLPPLIYDTPTIFDPFGQGIPQFLGTNAPLPLTGTYVLAISTPDGSTTGTANFTLYNVPPDITGTINANGTALITNITTPGQGASLTFNATAGQRFSLLTSFPASDLQVLLYQLDGANLLYYADMEPGDLSAVNAWSDLRIFPQAGTYTFKFIPSFRFAGAEPDGTIAQVPTLSGSSGSLTTTLFNVPPDIDGQFPSGGGTVTATTTVPGQHVNETFTGQAGQTAFLQAQLGSGFLSDSDQCTEVVVAVVEPDGSTLYAPGPLGYFFPPSASSGPITLPESGTYTFSFDPTSSPFRCSTPPSTGSITISANLAPPPVNGGTLVAGGAPVSATTTAPGQGATFTFSGTAGQIVSLLAETGDPSFAQSQANYSLSISGPSGFVARTSGGGIGSSFTRTGWVTLPSTGSYSVQFTPQTPAGSGAITMQLDAPITGTLAAGGPAVTSSVTAPGDQILMSFSGTAGQAVELVTQMAPAFGVGYQLTILPPGDAPDQNPSTPALYSNTLNNVPNDTGFLILPSTGTYTVQFTPSQPVTGAVTMTLNSVPAGAIGIGGEPVTASVASANQIVTLQFSGSAGQPIVLAVQPASAFDTSGYAVTITDPDGVTTLYSTETMASVLSSGTLSLPVTGTYTIQFFPQGSATGTVTFALQVPSQQTLTIGGGPVSLDVASPGTMVVASFSGIGGPPIVLLATPSAGFNNQPYALSVIEPDGQSTLYATSVTSQNPASPTLTSGALMQPEFGTYTIEFTPGGSATGTVVLQLETPVNGGQLTVGGAPVTVSASQPGDAVSFTFSTAGQGGRLAELLIQPDPLLANPNYTVELFDPDGNLISTQNPPGGPSVIGGTFVLENFGTLTDTVLVSPGSAVTGNIAATLFAAGEGASGVSIAPAALAVTATANVATAGATGQAQFSGTAGGIVALLTQADINLRQACYTVTLLEPDGRTPLYSNQQAGVTDFSPPLTLPSSGTYTIDVTSCGSATGNAALTVYAVPANAPGSTTIGGTPSSVQTIVPAQAAQVTFPTGTANQTANIAVTADASFASACYNVTITDPNNNVVNTGQGCGTGYSSGVLTLPTIGTYTVTTASVSTAVGNVTVGVTAQ